MKIGYLVTSAINTRFGVYDTESRLKQTLETFASIKARDANAHLTLIEMAAVPLADAQKEELNKHVDALIDFTNDDLVRRLSIQDNWDIVKNATEMLCFRHAIKIIQDNPTMYTGVDRFVKVSGRYKLNADYDPAIFESATDKIFFAKRRQSQFPPEVTGNVSEQFMSRCWSFPATELAYIDTTFKDMLTHMELKLSMKGYIDIEHLLQYHISKNKIVEVDKIGVEGNIGPNGVLVKD
jgi:hypothetical protein